MNYKYDLNEIVYVRHLVDAEAKVVDKICKSNINFYQVKVLENKYKDKLLWFAEHEIYKDREGW